VADTKKDSNSVADKLSPIQETSATLDDYNWPICRPTVDQLQ